MAQLPDPNAAPSEDFLWGSRCTKATKFARDRSTTRCIRPPMPVFVLPRSGNHPNSVSSKEKACREARRKTPLHLSPWAPVSTTAQPFKNTHDEGRADAMAIRSRSSPSLLSPSHAAAFAGLELERKRQLRREHVRREMAFSPQGLFARNTPLPKNVGSETGARFWDSLRLQEDELRAHIFAQPKQNYLEGSQPATTKPQGVAEGNSRPETAQTEAFVDIVGVDVGKQQLAPLDRMKIHAMKKFTVSMFDIREGLRVIILGGTPTPLSTEKVWPPSRRQARMHGTQEETLRVYNTYREVLAMESSSASADDDEAAEPCAAVEIDDDGATTSGSVESQRVVSSSAENLTPISWPTMYLWVEQTMAFTEDARIKSACAAFLRGLKHWRSAEAPLAQRYAGVYLHVIMKWLWPAVTPAGLAKMHTWICLKELEKIRVPTPPVIGEQERKRIESVFKVMDVDGKGYCTAKDLAGGDSSDIQTKLKNTIDTETVGVVYGEGSKFDLNRFSEIMCSDNHMGHEKAKMVIRSNGGKLIHIERAVAGWEGWVCFDVPPAEIPQRKRIDQLEAEIVRWQLAESSL
eukprot:TRINITY_DN75457_c0_g1_i1.p1 TRINITY_DN75457_c0_g1~~TRINITY_DN75457_c0_g1_i1.p1  ORF type:complete len:576 (+),score=93.49 TRINITY_DN75457_c0_g1_i1:301-2028(+)